LRFPHSLGLLYSAFTYYFGFKVNSGEYKLMGLAPYGNPLSENVKRYMDIIKHEIVEINDDGSIWLNQEVFDYSTEFRMVKDEVWTRLFDFPPRRPESDELTEEHCNLAYAIQAVTEETVLKMALKAKRLTNSDICAWPMEWH